MNITSLNQNIIFQKLSAVADTLGNRTNHFEDYYSCHALVSGSGNETEAAGQTSPKETTDFTVRWCKALNTVTSDGFRILSDGKIYNILYVDLMGGRRRTLKFHCERTRS
jgi:SPP1 family predicted phage head-tail adaptor